MHVVKKSMMNLMQKLMYNCDHASFLISKSFHKKLTYSEKNRLKMHLAMCKHCRNYQNNMNILQKGIRKLRTLPESQNGMFKLTPDQKESITKTLSSLN